MSPYSASVLDEKIETGYGQFHDENERTNTAAFITCSKLQILLKVRDSVCLFLI